MTVPVRPKNVGVWGAAVSAVLHLLVFGPVTPCHGVEQPSDDADDAGTQTVIDSSRRFGLNPGTEKSGGSTLASLENDVQKPPPHKTDDREVSCHRYVVSGAGDIRANGQYAVVTNSVDHNGGAVPTPGLYKRCSTAAEAGTPHDCDKYFELYSLPAWPAAGTWRIRGWNKKVEYVAANETAAGAAPPQHWLSPDASSGPAPVSVACNRTDDDSYLPPKLVVVGQAEMIWNQTADACPGSCGCPACGNPAPCSWENPGESPDSMPIAFHDELRNESRLISATPWGTYAHVGTTLHDLPLRHDCSHSLFNEFNSTDPAKFADHQWMQSVRLMPDGSGSALIHSEMHGDLSGNWSLCSIQRETNHTVAPRGECQYWSSGLGKTTDGGASWRLAEPPPAHMVFSPDRKYEKDSPNLGFGAIGGMLELDGFVYGHVNEIAAGAAGPHPHGWAASSGVCAFRVPADSVGDPKAFRGWTGTGWNKQFKDPYIATATQVCKPIVAGFEGNAHPQLRRLTGKALIERQRKDGWPTHLMLGWPENVKGTEFAYAYPKNWRGNNQSAEEAPFTEWTEAVTVDVGPWIDPSSHLFPIMYPSILDADSPFSLSAMPGASKADGLSYALVGNESAYIYIVARRVYLGRIPVAFVPWWQQPLPAPFPPPPPSALNPAGCKAFDVVGAGDAACNGKYVATSNISYTKDATHQLYFFGGHWKMAHEGVGPVYYTAHDIRGGVKRVPVTSWQGTPPSPNVTCIDRPLKNDDSCAFAPHDWVAVRTLKSVSASSRAECCAKCIATPSCEAGTLDTAGQCYLKAGLQSTTSCSNCTSCTLPGKDVASILFGPSSRFTMRLNPATLGLQNISVSSHDGAFTQGFLANEMALPRRTEYALWRLNITDCKTTLPEGTMVTPCIGNDCGNTSHTVSPNGSTLTLRWAGVPLSAKFKGVRLDVTVTVAQLPGSKPGVSLRGAVSLSASSASSDGQVCLQNMALPTLDGIQMRSETTDTMFIPDFFGHTGKCSAGSCKMDMKLNWDGMIDQVSGTKEYNYMPNGNDRAMQWFSFYSNYTRRSLGLYVGAHDPDSHLQLAMATGAWPTRTYAGGAALHWYHIPDNPLAPLNGPESAWEMAYEVVLQGFEGDWYDGAQIYREWVLQNARWTRRGDVATRLANKEFPEYLTTTPFLIESDVGRSSGTYGHGADKNDTIANMVRIMKLLGVKEMINCGFSPFQSGCCCCCSWNSNILIIVMCRQGGQAGIASFMITRILSSPRAKVSSSESSRCEMQGSMSFRVSNFMPPQHVSCEIKNTVKTRSKTVGCICYRHKR